MIAVLDRHFKNSAKIGQVLVQNVFYAITHLRQLSMHFLNVRKYIHCGDRVWLGMVGPCRRFL